jgi:transposase
MACLGWLFKSRCTIGPQRRITLGEHEDVLEAVQRRLDLIPGAMR